MTELEQIEFIRERANVTYAEAREALAKYNYNLVETVTSQADKKKYDLLVYLSENSNIILSWEKILEAVWGYDYPGDTNIVDAYIRYLRSKIDEKYGLRLIQTVRGVGYVVDC